MLTILNPIAVKLLTGKLVLPFGFKLPLIDETSFFGYSFNLFHHLIQDFIVVVGFIYSDALYAAIVIHIYCVYDILILRLDELKNVRGKELKKRLIAVILLHQELLRYKMNLLDATNIENFHI